MPCFIHMENNFLPRQNNPRKNESTGRNRHIVNCVLEAISSVKMSSFQDGNICIYVIYANGDHRGQTRSVTVQYLGGIMI